MQSRFLGRLVIAIVAVASLALPVKALAAFGDQEIPVFRVGVSTTQAGGHPNVNLFFRFCNRGLDIVDVSNTSPIEVTTAQPHGIASGQFTSVRIVGVQGTTAANGDWNLNLGGAAHVVDADTFQLPGSTGNGAYVPSQQDEAQIAPRRGCLDTTDRSQITAKLKDFQLHLPPGFLGNPQAAAICSTEQWSAAFGSCPTESILGSSVSETIPEGSTAGGPILPVFTPLFNVQTIGLEPARLGTDRFGSTPPGPFPIIVRVRTEGDFGITSALVNIPRNLGGPQATIMEIKTLLCSHVPCNPNTGAHGAGAKPFFVNPTRCDVDKKSVLEARSWFTDRMASSEEDPNNDGNIEDRPSFRPTGCQNVPFGAFMKLASETTTAGNPSGQTVTIQYPRSSNCPPSEPDCTYEYDEIWQSQLRDADVSLPAGMELSPGGGVGLEGCTAEQFGVDLATNRQTNEPARCPKGSDIGDILVKSPVLPTPLDGQVFFGPTSGQGRPTPDRPWKLFLLIEGHGLRIKLVGDVSVDENGKVRTVFRSQPEVPFSTFELRLKGGDNAVLMNPTSCDPSSGNAVLTGWADMPGAPKQQTNHPQFRIAPTACPGSRPFAPVVEEAKGIPEQAGANSVSKIVISKPDANQDLRSLKLSLPAGAVGSLAAVPQCSLADARAGTCSDASRIGNIKTTVGRGNGLLTVPGYLYLAEPAVDGDAATIAIKVPSKVGPIDLGDVVLLNRVMLRPTDNGVDVESFNDIPYIFGGIPIPVRRVEITVDREGFFLNPTGCDPRTLTTTFRSWEGAEVASNTTLTATGCERLSFGPRLRMIAGAPGLTDQFDHPPLQAIVTQKPGESNISLARVILPLILRPNVPFFNEPGALCNDAQAAARACPPKSLAGTARVSTPVLPFMLTGPVHIVQEVGNVLPKLYVFLRGRGLEVVLRARNSFLGGRRTINTFEGLPDVPQSYFELNIKGGDDGILNNFEDLCTSTKSDRVLDARFFGHSGKMVDSKPELEIRGCEESDVRAASLSSRSLRVSRKGIAKMKVRCKRKARCRGRVVLRGKGVTGTGKFRIAGRKTRTVRVKFSRSEVRRLRKARRLRTRGTLTIGVATAARANITLIGPRKRR